MLDPRLTAGAPQQAPPPPAAPGPTAQPTPPRPTPSGSSTPRPTATGAPSGSAPTTGTPSAPAPAAPAPAPVPTPAQIVNSMNQQIATAGQPQAAPTTVGVGGAGGASGGASSSAGVSGSPSGGVSGPSMGGSSSPLLEPGGAGGFDVDTAAYPGEPMLGYAPADPIGGSPTMTTGDSTAPAAAGVSGGGDLALSSIWDSNYDGGSLNPASYGLASTTGPAWLSNATIPSHSPTAAEVGAAGNIGASIAGFDIGLNYLTGAANIEGVKTPGTYGTLAQLAAVANGGVGQGVAAGLSAGLPVLGAISAWMSGVGYGGKVLDAMGIPQVAQTLNQLQGDPALMAATAASLEQKMLAGGPQYLTPQEAALAVGYGWQSNYGFEMNQSSEHPASSGMMYTPGMTPAMKEKADAVGAQYNAQIAEAAQMAQSQGMTQQQFGDAAPALRAPGSLGAGPLGDPTASFGNPGGPDSSPLEGAAYAPAPNVGGFNAGSQGPTVGPSGMSSGAMTGPIIGYSGAGGEDAGAGVGTGGIPGIGTGYSGGTGNMSEAYGQLPQPGDNGNFEYPGEALGDETGQVPAAGDFPGGFAGPDIGGDAMISGGVNPYYSTPMPPPSGAAGPWSDNFWFSFDWAVSNGNVPGYF